MKALVIGRGVQGKRWIKNLQQLSYSTEIYGRDYKEKLQRNQYYDIIILAVPHNAFVEVAETLLKYKISGRKVIVEKPGARNLDEYILVMEALAYVGYSEMFLPVYIEYGFVEPRKVEYVGALSKISIKEIRTNEELLILKNGRSTDMIALRDLFWHPASFYKNPEFNVKSKITLDKELNKTYVLYYLVYNGKEIIIGKRYENPVRKMDGKDITFTNPMLKQLKQNYEELTLDKLPLRIWKNLDSILQ